MQHSPTALVCGAGVAGLAVAWWLRHVGFHVTLVEREPMPRGGGHAVDIRGAALQVVAAMGLLDAVQRQRTRLQGMTLLDRDGMEIGRDDTRTFSAGRLDSADIEIFRDALCDLLAQAADAPAYTQYGERITAIEQDAHGVTASFAGHVSRTFDVLIGADGVYSSVRRQVLKAGDECLRPLGGALAFYSAPNVVGLGAREWMYRDAGLGVVVYPDSQGTGLRIGAGFGAEVDAALRHDVAAQRALVQARLQPLGGRWRALAAAAQTTDAFYFGELVQVMLPSWSSGRVALVGDAAHCASPFSGQGTSLALVGAYVLARELARSPTAPAAAFARYETRMRPYVDLNQALVDMDRQGPVPDAQMAHAANAIALFDLDDD
ncbi:FAD-dependent monooxygenase [Stenotrophomonas sp. LGBM10]|uniref:FAD-dependent monooxygenase n=1 Tax=Stenotrophomonas sp. LGBM10 TaxID=3390038 RepID=UPI00398AFBD9